MAKPALPGLVKTRLAAVIGPKKAAQVHLAMLNCVLARASAYIKTPGGRYLALGQDQAQSAGALPGLEAASYHRIYQGGGDLGTRMARVWQVLGSGPLVFLGADSPDVPAEALAALAARVRPGRAVLGPAHDGGYWTLAASGFEPRLLRHIDWGGPTVYDQTVASAKDCGMKVTRLRRWYDVDDPAGLARLLRRLEGTKERPLVRLRSRLRRILDW